MLSAFKAHRTQDDDLQEVASQESGLDCSDRPDMTRQEFKAETDIHFILQRFGIEHFAHPGAFTEVDFTQDLQSALAAIKEVEEAHNNLPPELKTKFPNWELVIQQLRSGELILDKATNPPTLKVKPVPVPAPVTQPQ